MCSLNKTLTKETNTPSARKEVNPMPSPFGEGQINTPINHHYLGEVQINPSPVSLRYGMLRDPPRGRSRSSLNKTLLWKINKSITQQAPFPFGKGGGIGPSQTPYSPEMMARLCPIPGHSCCDDRGWGYSIFAWHQLTIPDRSNRHSLL